MTDNDKTRGKRIEKLQIMVAGEEIELIDDWRFETRSASRANAIRRLIYLGIRYWEKHPDDAKKAIVEENID